MPRGSNLDAVRCDRTGQGYAQLDRASLRTTPEYDLWRLVHEDHHWQHLGTHRATCPERAVETALGPCDLKRCDLAPSTYVVNIKPGVKGWLIRCHAHETEDSLEDWQNAAPDRRIATEEV